ncbi:MAG: APC family permease [Woeseiaceae bacterium]|nr:APC family permease [Woeseiaceae bacterium]
MSDTPAHVKTLGRRDIVLFTVSAILLLDTLAAGAAVGPAAVFWWIFLGIVFFVPYALISAEMGTTYPEQGGLYAWIRDAFGRRWASRATWAYWINTAVWMPAGYILFAGVFTQMFMPGMSLAAQIGLGVALTWIAVIINVVTLDVGKWIPNLGALFKLVIIVAIIIGAVLYTAEHGMANTLTFESMRPGFDGSLEYFSVIIYGMLGFELVSAGSDEMKNPARDVPVSILVSGLIIISMYTLATVAILAAIPAGDIDLVEGLVDTLRLFFGGTPAGDAFAIALGIGALYTFFANGVTWALGCNRAMAEAAQEHEFPALLGRERAVVSTPVGAAVMMGCVSTAALLLYGLMAESSEGMFWSLFAFSAAIFLIPYIILVFAFLRMRYIDGERHRPFRVPGGNGVAALLALTCGAILAFTLLLFVYTPGEGINWPIFGGAVTVVAFGELLIRYSESVRGRN